MTPEERDITDFLQVITTQPDLFTEDIIQELIKLQSFIASPVNNKEVADKLFEIYADKRNIIDAINNLERGLSPIEPQPSKAGYETLKNKYPDLPISILEDLKKRSSTPNSSQINDTKS